VMSPLPSSGQIAIQWSHLTVPQNL